MNANINSFHEISNKVSFKNVDLNIFQEKLYLISDNINNYNLDSKTIQEKYEFFIKSIIDSINMEKIVISNNNKIQNNNLVNMHVNNVNNDVNKFKSKKISAPWWDKDCDKLMSERKLYLKNLILL